jgi:hypothetical protein
MAPSKDEDGSSWLGAFEDIDVRIIDGSFNAGKVITEFFNVRDSRANNNRFFQMPTVVKTPACESHENHSQDEKTVFSDVEPVQGHHFSIIFLFQPEQPEKEWDEDDDVQNFLLPFLAFQKVPDDQEGNVSGEDVIKDCHDHE